MDNSDVIDMTSKIADIIHTDNTAYIVDVKEMMSFILNRFHLNFNSVKPYIEEYIIRTNEKYNECKHSIIIVDEIDDTHVTCLRCDGKWDCKECYNTIADNNYLWSSHRCSFKGECNHTSLHTETCDTCSKVYTYHRIKREEKRL